MTMLLRADAGYSTKEQSRRDDLRNHLQSLNRSTSRTDPESSNVWDALPGSKWGSCTDLLTGPKSRPLPKALRPKSPKDEQRSLSYSYRAPVLALPPTLPLTKAPRQSSEQRSRTNSFGGFSSQTLLSSAPSWDKDNAFVGPNNHVKMSKHEEPSSPERCVVTLRRPESPLPGTAQAHAQMLWIEKVRRGSDTSAEYNTKEPLWNSKAKEAHRNYQNGGQASNHTEKESYPANESYRHCMQEEQGRNYAKVEPHRNNQATEPSWNDTSKNLHLRQPESEPYCDTGFDSRLNNNGKTPYPNHAENHSQRNNVENEPYRSNRKDEPYRNNPVNESYISHAEMETRRNNPEKELDLRWNSNDYSMEKKSQNNNNTESYSSRFNHVDSDEAWNKPKSQPSLRICETESHRNSKEKQPSCNGTQKEEQRDNRNYSHSSPTKSESDWNYTIAKEPHRNGGETIHCLNYTDKEPHLNGNEPQSNNQEKESSWNQKMKEPHSEETQHQRPGAILPSRFTHSYPSAPRSFNNHQGSSVEPTSPYPQRKSLTEPRTSSGDELRLATSPLYKLSSFRYGSGRESPSGVHQNDPARGKELPKTIPLDGKTSDRTFRDRALSQGATLPRLLNKYLSGSVNDLSRGSDDQRRSGERKLPMPTEERVTSGVTHRGPNQVSSSTPLISDRWRTLDREDRTSNKYVTGGSVQTPSALYKTRNRWASLDRDQGRSQTESSTHRTDQSSSSGLNAAQLSTAGRFSFEPSKPIIDSTFRKRESSSSRPASCTPSDQTRRSYVATGGQDLESAYSNGRSRARSPGALSPSSRRLYGSEMNLASIGSRQDPSYMAMTSSRYPSGRDYDQDGTNVTGSERFQSETLRRSSSPRLNPAQPSGISTPHYGPPITSVQLKLMPHHSDFYSAKSNGQWEDATRSTTVSSLNHAEPATESSSGTMRQFNGACDSMEPSVDYTQQGVGSERMPPLGITMRATAYPSVETKTQMLDGNRIEDSRIGFSGSSIRSSAASPIREDLKFNREEIITDERRLVHDAPVDTMTTSVGSRTLNNSSPLVGHSAGVSSSGYSDKYYVKGLREGEKDENIGKEIFTKEDWISSARRTGKSPTPVENRVMTVIPDDRKKMQVHGREANARSSDRSAPPVEWKEQQDNMEANTRNEERAILNTGLSVKENLNSPPPRISTAAKWKEFLNGSIETDSSHSDHSCNERRREGTITIGENLGYSRGKVDPERTKDEGSTFQLPVERKEETSRTTRSMAFDADEDIPRRVGNRREDFIVSEAPQEMTSTLGRSSVGNHSNMEDGVKRGDKKMEDVSQVEAKMNERNMEGSCNGGVVQGLREVEIYVQRGALGVGFCVEGGLQSTLGDKPITIKRIFAGADGHLRGKLRAGDEILRVNDKDFRQMSHYKAWNFLKTLPEGPAKLLIFSK